jgi:hypothetical protein
MVNRSTVQKDILYSLKNVLVKTDCQRYKCGFFILLGFIVFDRHGRGWRLRRLSCRLPWRRLRPPLSRWRPSTPAFS